MGAGSRGRPRVHVYKGDRSRVSVGRLVTIGPDVEFMVGGNHRIDWVTTYPLREMYDLPGAYTDNPWSKGDIVVGDRVRIGRGAKILSGVRIGDDATIAPHSVVASDVAAGTVVTGNPARRSEESAQPGRRNARRVSRLGKPFRRAGAVEMTMGRGSYGPPHARAFGPSGSVTVGNYGSISAEVGFFFNRSAHEVSIGSDVWIGRGATIAAGAVIGDGAVVGAYAVVQTDVAPFSVVVGDPARAIRRRFDDATVDALLRIGWWNWPEDAVVGSWKLLCSPDVSRFIDEHDS